MATVTGSESLAVAEWEHGSDSKSDRYLATRLAAASADYKGVAMATFALGAAVAAVAWLALGVLVEHWLVPGGLPVAARWLWLGLGVSALVAAVVRWVVPLVRYRVNLVYAARVIEHDHPELHNDLVNAVLVKAHPDGASPRVARMLERRAAKRLSGVPADGIADRGLALRLAMALAVLVAAGCIYQLVAPKSLVVSAGRLVAPWWGIAAPARVTIKEPRLAWRMPPDEAGGERPAHPLQVSRGAGSLIRGRQLLVETDVTGLRGDERPTLEVTPIRDDGTVDAASAWRVSLAAAGRSAAMATVLPDAVRGLQHGVELVVTAGDARSERIRVAVVDTPTLLVREVRYEFPAYTGKPPETVAWQGDLRAPEFTKVTLTAESNRPLDVAWVDPECAGRESERKRLRIGQHDLSRAIGEFPLRMNADRTGPEFASYRLGFRPRAAAGAPETEIVEKLEQRVEVIPDLPPEVTIEAPDDAIRVPPSAPVAIRVRAVDPDYALARVFVEARVDGAPVRPEARLLEKPHAGVFNGTVEIVPERLGAIAGRKLEYRAVVEDTRPERPNRTESPWRTLQIDAAARPQPPARQPAADGERAEQGDPQGVVGAAEDGAPGEPRHAGEQKTMDGQQGGQQGGQHGGQQGGGAGREPRQDGQVKVNQSRTEKVGDVTQKQDQNQNGKAQKEEQHRKNAVANDGTNDGEAMERILRHRGKGSLQQEQEQVGQPEVNQKLNAEVGDVAQQQDQEQRGDVQQERNQDGESRESRGQQDGVGSGSQSRSQALQDHRGSQQRTQQQNEQAQSDNNQNQQAQAQQEDASASQDQETQKQQGQAVVSQRQQSQVQQGQGVVSQQQQGQVQQAQGVVSQQQQGQAQQGQGVVGQQQQLQKEGPSVVGQSPRNQLDLGNRASSREMEWTDPEVAHARNAADLAIEHLRDSVNQGRTDVLDELGWTPEQARAFIERWQKMRSLAESGDPVQRGEFERSVRSLGLRPNGVRSGRDVPADRKGGEAEGRRSRPPAAYREQVEAYLRGTGGG
ncbi:MAG: hypothetical protein ACKON7_13520 [Planctomycetaceae bacterium]